MKDNDDYNNYDLIDLLDWFGCRRLLTKDNIHGLIMVARGEGEAPPQYYCSGGGGGAE